MRHFKSRESLISSWKRVIVGCDRSLKMKIYWIEFKDRLDEIMILEIYRTSDIEMIINVTSLIAWCSWKKTHRKTDTNDHERLISILSIHESSILQYPKNISSAFQRDDTKWWKKLSHSLSPSSAIHHSPTN